MTELQKQQFTADIYSLFPKYANNLTDVLDVAEILQNIADDIELHGKVMPQGKSIGTSSATVYNSDSSSTTRRESNEVVGESWRPQPFCA